MNTPSNTPSIDASIEWAQGHNDGYYDTVEAIKDNLRKRGLKI